MSSEAGTNPLFSQLAAYADQVHPALDRLGYYQLLGVAADADARAVKAAYHKLAAQLHPDRYHGLPDAATRERLETIYARMTEAYRVLSSPDKRAAYDRGLGEGKLRWDSSEREKKAGPRNPEDAVAHPEARKFFRLGMICLGRKDWRGAAMNFNFARTFEPGSAVIAEKLAEAQAGQKGAAPPPR